MRPWQFTAAICFYILLTKLTVLHSFRKEQVSLRDNDMVCLIVANNESCLSYMLPVNMPLTVTLIIISFSSPTLSFIPDLKPSFSAKYFPLQPFFFFFRTDYMIPQTFTVTSNISVFTF